MRTIRAVIVAAILLVLGLAACGVDTDSSNIGTGDNTTVTTAPNEDPELTEARERAVSYLETSGFSRSGLIGQLEFEGYPTDKATKAVDSLDVDWNVEAEQKAASYVENSSFSHQGLVDQLAFEGFTPQEAEHGATVALG